MTPEAAVAIVGAGVAAGTINTVVGSGSLVTFPVLLALGYPALLANVSNNVGMVPGGLSGVIGYRRELLGQGRRIRVLAAAAATGGLIGAGLLLVLPSSVFARVVPILILLACALVIVQPALRRKMVERGERHRGGAPAPLQAGILATAVYGGYFGAAQGVILLSLLGIFVHDHLQRLNATKNVLAMVTNGAAAVVFVIATPISWPVAGLLAAGTMVGGQLGARVGRRLPPMVLRVTIVVIGLVAVVKLLW